MRAKQDGNTQEQSTGHMHEDSMRKPITLCADLKRKIFLILPTRFLYLQMILRSSLDRVLEIPEYLKLPRLVTSFLSTTAPEASCCRRQRPPRFTSKR